MDQGLWQTLESIDFIFIIILVNTNNIVMWEILLSNADWDCFRTDFAGDLEDSKSTSEGTLFFGSHTFVPTSWMCKKQTSVSHSSTESEIISLDTGLRLDGLPALELWDLIVSVFGNISHISDRTGKPVNGKNKSHNKIDANQDMDSVPSNVQSAHQEALLFVLEDNEAVIKMIMTGRSPTMRHVSRTHRVALDWLFGRINLDPKIQIKYIDTKNQLADILTKGNFTRDEWNHLLNLFWHQPFQLYSVLWYNGKTSSTRFRRRTCHSQIATHDEFDRKNAFGRVISNFIKPGEDLVWISRSWKICFKWRYIGETWETVTTRLLTRGLWSIFSQEWKSGAAEHDSSGKPETISWDILQKVDRHREEHLLGRKAHSARYEETIHDGSEKPETVNHQEANSKNFVMGSEATEFVNKVKDQVRSRQKRMSNVAESGEEYSIIWWMFMVATMNAATFMGKNFSTFQSVVKNLEDLTLKQMFDVTAQLVNNQDEINGLDKILGGKNSWKRLSLIGDETVINLQSTIVYVFSDSVLCFGKVFNNLNPTKLGRTELHESDPRKATETMMLSMESRLNSSGTSSQDSQRCSSVIKSMIYWATWDKHEKLSQESIMSMFNDISCDRKTTKMNAWQMPESWKYLREDLVLDNGHLLDQVLKRSGILQRKSTTSLG